MTIDYHQKYCLECKWFHLDLGSEDYSEETPGDQAALICFAGHYWLNRDDYGPYKKIICMARICPDFEPDPELAKIGEGLARLTKENPSEHQ